MKRRRRVLMLFDGARGADVGRWSGPVSGSRARRGGTGRGWLVLLPLIAACAAPRIHVEVEAPPNQAFARYAGYCWWRDPKPAQDPAAGDALLDWRVRNAVDAEFAGKGCARMPRRSCDVIVAYTVTTRTREVETFGEFADYRARGGEGGLQDVLGGYPEGTLALQLFDASTRELIWRASASAVIDPAQQKERVAEAVRRMLQDLPRCTRAKALPQ